jgi:hypothetical protein
MRSDRGSFSTLAKLFAEAAGCTFAMVSFDARAVLALPIPLQQPLHVTQIAGGGGPGWHRGPYGAAPGGTGARPPLVPANTPYGPRRVCRWCRRMKLETRVAGFSFIRP